MSSLVLVATGGAGCRRDGAAGNDGAAGAPAREGHARGAVLAFPAGTYGQLTILGVLDGAAHTGANAINLNGDVAGTEMTATASKAWRYTAATSALAYIPIAPDDSVYTGWEVSAINASGVVVGSSGWHGEGFSAAPGQTAEIVTDRHGYASANGINDAGQIAVNGPAFVGNAYQGYLSGGRLDPDGTRHLIGMMQGTPEPTSPTVGGGTFNGWSVALGIGPAPAGTPASVDLVGYAGMNEPNRAFDGGAFIFGVGWGMREAYRFSDPYTGAADRHNLNDYAAANGWQLLYEAAATNGTYVVGWGAKNGRCHAFRYTIATNEVIDLDAQHVLDAAHLGGDLCGYGQPGHFNYHYATGINTSHEIVGNVGYGGAFYYSDATGTIDLQDLVDPASNVTILTAAAINDNHEIVGTMIVAGNPKNRAYKLKLPGMVDCATANVDDGDSCTLDACSNDTGVSHTPLADGAPCTDDDACTQVDTCMAGVCVGSAPKTCDTADMCHLPGTCDPATGLCPSVPDGTPCSDDDACTQIDLCTRGECVGTSPTVCLAADDCHAAGACDPATGVCSSPAVDDGAACDDGNGCTDADRCEVGSCVGDNRCSPTPGVALAAFDYEMMPHAPGTDLLRPGSSYSPAPIPVPVTCGQSQCSPGMTVLKQASCIAPDGSQGCKNICLMSINMKPVAAAAPCVGASGCQTGALRACTSSCGQAGTSTCVGGAWGPCRTYEVCDGHDNDCDGQIDNGNVCQKPLSAFDPQHRPGWDAVLDARSSSSPSDPIVRYVWEIDAGTPAHQSITTTSAKTNVTFAEEGYHPVQLQILTQGGVSATTTRNVRIKNYLVVSIGDSIASGEGNPDKPAEWGTVQVPCAGQFGCSCPFGQPCTRSVRVITKPAVWEDQPCHRSTSSPHYLAAQTMEAEDRHTSVTFLTSACSGARIDRGLICPQSPVKPSQLETVHNRLAGSARAIDALFLQVGGNDIGFRDIVAGCAGSGCSVGDGVFDALANGYVELEALFNQTNPGATNSLPPRTTYLSEYPNPTQSGAQNYCHIEFDVNFLGFIDGDISPDESRWAEANVVVPLNATESFTSFDLGWRYVSSEFESWINHGYCAADRWFVQFEESYQTQGDTDGSMHPNRKGYEMMSRQLVARVPRSVHGGPCGDGYCDSNESNATCPIDCRCGDRVCGEGESAASCPEDCTVIDDNICTSVEASLPVCLNGWDLCRYNQQITENVLATNSCAATIAFHRPICRTSFAPHCTQAVEEVCGTKLCTSSPRAEGFLITREQNEPAKIGGSFAVNAVCESSPSCCTGRWDSQCVAAAACVEEPIAPSGARPAGCGEDASRIWVKSASFGANCDDRLLGLETTDVAPLADGHRSFQFSFGPMNLQDPVPGCVTEARIEYQCTKGGATKVAVAAPDARGVMSLSCP